MRLVLWIAFMAPEDAGLPHRHAASRALGLVSGELGRALSDPVAFLTSALKLVRAQNGD